MHAIFTRTSVRKFTAQPVEQEKLEKILRAGFAAPSAVNQQPWEFYVVKNHAKIAQLAKASPYAGPAAEAPVVLVIVYRTTGLAAPELATIDCAIATENMWLALTDLGLGGVLLAIAPTPERMAKVHEILGLPPDQQAFALLPVGYPARVHPQQDRYDAAKVHVVE